MKNLLRRFVLSTRSVGLAAAMAFAALAWAPASAEVVKFGQATSNSVRMAPIYAAIELGYFREEGIELEFLNFKGAAVLLPQIANKEVTIGFPGPDPLIISHQPGRDAIPVKFFYNAIRESIWEFVVLEQSPLQRLADLKGKVIGVGALANANVPITRAMLEEIGLSSTDDYEFMAIGVGAPAFRATIDGQVDAYNTFDTNIAAFETTGTPLRRLPIDQKYRDLFSNGFVAHVDTIKDSPEILIGFGRAFTKGLIVCEANPDFCVQNFIRHNPDLKPSGATEEEVHQNGLHVLSARMQKHLSFPEGAERRFGEYSESSWKDFVKALHQGGELSTNELDVTEMFTNEFVDEFNDINVEQIKARALELD
ncbi:MAG: ABC transporter substrate-binding protein [Planctomycetaceae bacterium]|nr:ABC transporter substrate-binding protein [Planctomycetaceae bacterium]